MPKAKQRSPVIYVLAGANGAGKSSIGGEMFRAAGANYYNPDEETRRLREEFGQAPVAANSTAWHIGRHLLERAILTRTPFAFETTLSGRTMAGLLVKAAESGIAVKIWFCGLDSVERHLERVRQRVMRGGHDIPEAKTRQRYRESRERLIELLPFLTELKLYDNSKDSGAGMPSPRLVLAMHNGVLADVESLGATPAWAKPIVAAAMLLHRER